MTADKVFEFLQPVRVLFGKGQLTKLGDAASLLGRRIFLFTMRELLELGLVERAVTELRRANLDVTVFYDVQPEPTCIDVDTVAKLVRESGAQALVALGGGSVIDVAKAAAIRATHPEPTWMYVNLSNRPPLPIESTVLPIVAVPTTAGTGSEVTPYAVMSNDETRQKGTIKSPFIFPRVAIVDPELTLDLPPVLTAATGIDAFAHALESYHNKANRTPFSDLVAREAMRVLYKALPQVMNNGRDINLRAQMSWGSMLAGIAIANAGTTVAHAMAQPLGARTHLSHSLTVAIFTPPVLRHTWQADIPLFAALARLLNADRVAGLTEERQAEAAVAMVEELLKEVGMYHHMSEFGVKDEIIELLTADITGYMSRPLKQHPKVFSEDEVRDIIIESL